MKKEKIDAERITLDLLNQIFVVSASLKENDLDFEKEMGKLNIMRTKQFDENCCEQTRKEVIKEMDNFDTRDNLMFLRNTIIEIGKFNKEIL